MRSWRDRSTCIRAIRSRPGTFISLAQRVETAGETNLPIEIVENLRRTIDRGKQVYTWAKELCVPIALGTDLWGPDAQKSQPREFEQRVDLDSPRNILCSATVVNAELLMLPRPGSEAARRQSPGNGRAAFRLVPPNDR